MMLYLGNLGFDLKSSFFVFRGLITSLAKNLKYAIDKLAFVPYKRETHFIYMIKYISVTNLIVILDIFYKNVNVNSYFSCLNF